MRKILFWLTLHGVQGILLRSLQCLFLAGGRQAAGKMCDFIGIISALLPLRGFAAPQAVVGPDRSLARVRKASLRLPWDIGELPVELSVRFSRTSASVTFSRAYRFLVRLRGITVTKRYPWSATIAQVTPGTEKHVAFPSNHSFCHPRHLALQSSDEGSSY